MPHTVRRLVVVTFLAIGNAQICTAQNLGGQQTSPASKGQYTYRVLVGLKNDATLRAALQTAKQGDWDRFPLTREVCAAFDTAGTYFQTRATGVSGSDEIVMLAARWKVTDTAATGCELIPFYDIGIQQQEDISLYSRGFEGGQLVPVQIRNQGLEDDVRHAIEGRFRILRIPVSRLLVYRDAKENEVRVQHYEVLRLAVNRHVPSEENTGPAANALDTRPNAGVPVNDERHLYWEFRIARKYTWTGLEFPTLWSYVLDSKAAKALPVAIASGVRIGTKLEFPRYLDLTLFAAPAFKLKADSSADVTSLTMGGLVDFADYFGVAVGVDHHDGKFGTSILVSIGSKIRSAFPK
jgi:hypothetical protein